MEQIHQDLHTVSAQTLTRKNVFEDLIIPFKAILKLFLCSPVNQGTFVLLIMQKQKQPERSGKLNKKQI